MLDIYQTLEIKAVLEEIALETHSEVARSKILSLRMLSNKDDIRLALNQVDEMMSLLNERDSLPIQASFDLSKYLEIAKKGGVLSIAELDHIALDIETSQKLNQYFARLDQHHYPSIYELKEQLFDLSKLEESIRHVISPNLVIYDTASVELNRIRKQILKLSGSVQDLSRGLIAKYAEFLSEKAITIRNDHFVLPVQTSYKNKVPGMIHDISDTGATTFVEPQELVLLSNQIYALRVEEKEEIYRLLKVLTEKVAFHEEEIHSNNKVIALLDEISSKAIYGIKHKCLVANLSDEQIISLNGARHPLIKEDVVIENSFELNKEQSMIIISGPNAGGKTVALKTLGLMVMMNQMGLAIPTKEKANLGYFPKIYADIGDNQSLSDNLSTFAAHVSNLSTITHFVTGKDLVLLDELGTGTSPREGEALALAVSDFLLKKHVFSVISSHFDKMKEFAYAKDNVINAMMIFDEHKLLPTYRLKIGSSGRSYGLEMAERYHLDTKVVNQAKRYLSNDKEVSFNDVLDRLNHLVNENEQKEKSLLEKERLLSGKEKHIHHEEEVLRNKKEKLLEDVKHEQKKIIDRTTQKVDLIMKNLDKDQLKLHEIIHAKTELKDLAESQDEEEIYLDNGPISLHDYVEVKGLGLVGRVEKINGEKVQVITEDGFDVKTKLDQLVKVDEPLSHKKIQSNINHELQIKTDVKLELNIIGYHIDEGIEAVSKYLDECRLRHFKTVRIIHGMGSGKLREAVHAYLKKCDFVEDFHYGSTYDGGTGATVVTLK